MPPYALETLQLGSPHCSSGRALLSFLLFGLKTDLMRAMCLRVRTKLRGGAPSVPQDGGDGRVGSAIYFRDFQHRKPCGCPQALSFLYNLHPSCRSPKSKVYTQDFQCKLGLMTWVLVICKSSFAAPGCFEGLGEELWFNVVIGPSQGEE